MRAVFLTVKIELNIFEIVSKEINDQNKYLCQSSTRKYVILPVFQGL